MKHVLAIPGSLREGSFNRSLLLAATAIAPPDVAIALYFDMASLPLFSEDMEGSPSVIPGAVRSLAEAVAAADGLLIATAEYNRSIPGVLKNAIDWLSRPSTGEPLEGKPIAIVGASSGAWGTRLAQAALREVLTATESLVMPYPNLCLREAAGLFNAEGELIDQRTQSSLRGVLAAFERWIDMGARAATGTTPARSPH